MERRRLLIITAAAVLPLAALRAQSRPTIRIARIQGINFLPTYLMQQRRLVEAHAERLGLPGAQAEWIDFSGGGGATDAMAADWTKEVGCGLAAVMRTG